MGAGYVDFGVFEGQNHGIRRLILGEKADGERREAAYAAPPAPGTKIVYLQPASLLWPQTDGAGGVRRNQIRRVDFFKFPYMM